LIGTGKSFLSTRIISWGSDNSSPFAYFYFRGGNPETRSVLQALRDVAYQLSEIDAYYGKQVLRRVHSADDIKTVSSAYRRLFLQPFEDDTRGKPLRAVLDGVDEAYPSEIQQLFAELVPDDNGRVEKGKSRVQLLLAGRSYISDTLSNHIDQSENAHLYTTVHVTPERNSSDVKAFITEGVMHSRILNRSPMELKQEIINTMERRVDGLFILARFMLEEVNRKRRANSILQSLESYPKEINGMLKQTLASLAAAITDEDAEDLNEVLTWVTCAEQALTLEQLEAVLIMRFGDPPLRFEETLRRQHSVFVELRREDGLTTDDLIKYHQDVRRKQKRDSGSGSGSRPRRSSSAGKESPRRTLSPTQKMINSARRRTSPVLFGSSPDRHFSPSRSPDLVEPDEELEFRSKASTTTVNFFHASIREFFRDEDTSAVSREAGIPTIGFDITAARTHVLMTCLRIFNDERWFQKQRLGTRRQAIRQYAAWYWQEHVEDLELDLVDKEDKRTLGKYIYNMLADEHIIYEWTILYEANDEGLEILTDAHIKVLERWLSDADVRSGLDPIAQEWAGKAVVEANGITKKIGRLYAKAWISESFDKYVPTRFCFKIVQSIAFMDEGYKWSDSMCHWTQITDKKRIEKALDWAAEPKTAHWYRRVGSTYLVSGMHAEALEHYDEALKLDKNSVETLGRKAYCLWVEKRYREALNLTLECEGIEDKIIAAAQVSEAKLKASKWRLYKDHFLIARCYYRLGEVENAMGYFQKAINSVGQAKLDASERFEPVIGYLAVLATENRHADMIRLIQELSIQPTGPKDQMSRLLDLILFVFNKPLILEWIPKSAARVGEVDFLLERLEMAVGIAHDTRDHLKVLYLRLAIAITLIYGRRIEEAFELLEKIAFTEYRPRGNVPTRQAYATSFQKLAGLYKDRALHAGVSSPQSDKWISQLEQVRQSQITHHNLDMPVNMLGSDVNVAAIYLALFHRLKGEGVQAEGLLGDLIVESCEILEDEDTQNDEYALENLLRLFVAADDLTNARALAVSMRRLNPDAQLGTPADSPVRLREGVQAVEPKLPDIQSANRSCAQCLDIIAPEEEFFICRMCIESYCRKCMTEVIKQPGNRTGESTRGDTVICRSDHEWITVPPLGVLLHRGELWLGDGQVRGFIGWKDEVKKLWSRRGASRKH
jgi:tetratricopeptide (TPR) repeat protein